MGSGMPWDKPRVKTVMGPDGSFSTAPAGPKWNPSTPWSGGDAAPKAKVAAPTPVRATPQQVINTASAPRSRNKYMTGGMANAESKIIKKIMTPR